MHKRERKSGEYFLFEPRGARMNRADWFESCSFVKPHTHTRARKLLDRHTDLTGFSLCRKQVDFSLAYGGREDRNGRKRHTVHTTTGNQCTDNTTVPHRKGAFTHLPPLKHTNSWSFLSPQFPSLINGHIPVPLPHLEGTHSSLLLSPTTHKSWSRVCKTSHLHLLSHYQQQQQSHLFGQN